MPSQSSNQFQGRIAELEVMLSLEKNYLVTTDMTGSDYGIDVTLQLPLDSPAALSNLSKGQQSWKMTSNFCHIQIKHVKNLSLSVGHLETWVASNYVRPNSNYLLQVIYNGYILLRPCDLLELYNRCKVRYLKSASTGVDYGMPTTATPAIGKFFPKNPQGISDLSNLLWDEAGTPQDSGDEESSVRDIILYKKRPLNVEEFFAELNYYLSLLYPGTGIPESFLNGSDFPSIVDSFYEKIKPLMSEDAIQKFNDISTYNGGIKGEIYERNGDGFYLLRPDDISKTGLAYDVMPRPNGSPGAYLNLISSLQRYTEFFKI